MVSKANRKSNEKAIRATVRAFAGAADPKPLIAMADRESGWSNVAIGDIDAAAGVFERDREKIKKNGSPWTDDPSLWAGSYGLFQLMAPYEVQKWRGDAHPHLLFHPVISTILALRKWNRAYAINERERGDRPNTVDQRMIWAYGQKGATIKRDDKRYTDRVQLERDRWSKLGFTGDPLDPVQKYPAAGTGPQNDQQEKLIEICRELGLNPAKAPPWNWIAGADNTGDDETETETETETTSESGPSMAPILATIAGGALCLLAWQMSKKTK